MRLTAALKRSGAARAPLIAASFVSGGPAIFADRSNMMTAYGSAVWWSVLTVLCLVLLAPLTLADVPPMLDYPNHLARLLTLSVLPADPVFGRFYTLHWDIIPNLALDLTVPPLLRIFPVHLVGRAVAGLILLLPVLGAVAYHRALTGRLSYWPLGTVLFAYNAALLRGFLNFVASVGVALLFGAIWVAWRERRPYLAIAAAVLGAVALFFCHLIGLLFFAILIGGHELAAVLTPPFRFARIPRRIVVVLAVFAVPVVLYLISDLQGMEGAAEFRSAADKAHAALMPVMNYFWPLDLVTAALCVTIPAFCLARRWCAVPAPAALAIGVLLMLFIGLPAEFKGTNDLDTRFIVMAACLVPAALVPIAVPRRAAWAIGIGFLLLFGARMSVLTMAWDDWTGYLAAFRSVIAPVRPGDVVLTVRLPPRARHDLWTSVATANRLSDGTVIDSHLPALLLIEHRAWWPFLFDNRSQQPIQTRQPFRTLADRIDASSDPIGLLATDPLAMRLITHVLVRGPAPGPAEIDTIGLELIVANGDAALFRVLAHSKVETPPQP